MAFFAKTRERDLGGKFIVPKKPSGFDKSKYRKEYYIKNKQKIIQKSVDWGRKNKKKRKIAKDKWRAKNKERTNYLKRLYIYRKKHAEGKMSFEQIQDLYKRFSKCLYCNANKSNTIDHIIPLSRGGSNNVDNLLPVCVNCNSKKGSKLLIEWKPMLYIQYNQLARSMRFNAKS